MKLLSTGGVKVMLQVHFNLVESPAMCAWCEVSCVLQVYNVTSSKSLPEWLKGKTKGNLRKDEDYR